MKFEDKILKKHLRESKNDSLVQIESISRLRFEAFLSAIKTKLIISDNPDAEEKIADIEFMERNIERQIFINVNHSYQAKLILELQRQLLKVEFEKMEAVEQLVELKKRIK